MATNLSSVAIPLLLALLTLGGVRADSYPVWRPGIECWTVYESCKRLEHHRSFVRYMTGPKGTLQVIIRHPDGQVTTTAIRVVDIWPVWNMDIDGDGDLDLRDYAAFQAR